MTAKARSERGFIRPLATFCLSLAAIFVAMFYFGGNLRRFVRESLMQRATSSHYEILCPPGALSQTAMTEFVKQRESLFAALNKKLGDADSNTEVRIVLDPHFPGQPCVETEEQSYSVTGTSIRTKLNGPTPHLPAAADAEVLLYAAWGKPGNAEIARWTAIWLVGQWRGSEIGMAAAQVEQRLGHKKVASLLVDPGGEIASPEDRTLLGAAWINAISEFGGAEAVRKLYSTRMPHPSVADVAKSLGTTPLEIDRKWQLWIYAYLAGMPSPPRESTMPMNMPMAGSQ